MHGFQNLLAEWHTPAVPEDIPQGDMPEDRICVALEHVQKAGVAFQAVKEKLLLALTQSPCQRAVLSICGGSGVGKSEIASVLGYYLTKLGVNNYILSGDNYPHRIPQDNDRERLRVYRAGGLRGLVDRGKDLEAYGDMLRKMWEQDTDADQSLISRFPWLAVYQQAGRQCLAGYLGTPAEIDFEQVSHIVTQFQQGAQRLFLKRMGREASQLWYDAVEMRDIQVLIIEWTHGNSDYLKGVDIPIYLNSTPAETLKHRLGRNRDGNTDSAFTTMVLEIEQKKLEGQADKAALILSKAGEVLPYGEYRRLMAEESGGMA